jgi:hypothetical protein
MMPNFEKKRGPFPALRINKPRPRKLERALASGDEKRASV